ncbi:MAG: hypothetical protein HY059_22890 [Proteobacteria bacterium]|nr:hypothetical protein [Pseudomonadota bacterium]
MHEARLLPLAALALCLPAARAGAFTEDLLKHANPAPAVPTTGDVIRHAFGQIQLPGPLEEMRRSMLLVWCGNHSENEKKALLEIEKGLEVPPRELSHLRKYQQWIEVVANAVAYPDRTQNTVVNYVNRRLTLAARSAEIRGEFDRAMSDLRDDKRVEQAVQAASAKVSALRRDIAFFEALPAAVRLAETGHGRHLLEAMRIIARSGDLDQARAYLTANQVAIPG